MKPLVSTDIARARIAKWTEQARSLNKYPTWTERRQAIVIGEHTYLVSQGQVYQCAHCGHYDPEWSTTEVLTFFETTFGIKPIEVEITCTVNLDQE